MPVRVTAGAAANPCPEEAVGRAEHFAQFAVLALLLAAPALILCALGLCERPRHLWHMRTGQWILQHHAIPHVESVFRAECRQALAGVIAGSMSCFPFQTFRSFGLAGNRGLLGGHGAGDHGRAVSQWSSGCRRTSPSSRC